MVFINEHYSIHFYGRVRGKCDGRSQNWPGIANEHPKFLDMRPLYATATRPIPKRRRPLYATATRLILNLRDLLKGGGPRGEPCCQKATILLNLEENRAAKRRQYEEVLENRAPKLWRYEEDLEGNRAAKRQIYEDNSAAIKAPERSRYWNYPIG